MTGDAQTGGGRPTLQLTTGSADVPVGGPFYRMGIISHQCQMIRTVREDSESCDYSRRSI